MVKPLRYGALYLAGLAFVFAISFLATSDGGQAPSILGVIPFLGAAAGEAFFVKRAAHGPIEKTALPNAALRMTLAGLCVQIFLSIVVTTALGIDVFSLFAPWLMVVVCILAAIALYAVNLIALRLIVQPDKAAP